MSKVYVFLADGFEEIEGLTVVDLLRRAGVEVCTVSIMGKKMITGSHKITVEADALFEECDYKDADILVLPGGMPGTRYLGEHKELVQMLIDADKKQEGIAAICAAPSVLGQAGVLQGKKATSYPGFEDMLRFSTVEEYKNNSEFLESDFVFEERVKKIYVNFENSIIKSISLCSVAVPLA